MTDLDRRAVLRGVAVTGAISAVGPLLAACGSNESGNGSAGSEPTADDTSSPRQSETGNGNGGGDVLASTSDIPIGGGTVFSDEEVVVTQPEKGEFLAFTAICTHQGCTVNEVADGTINCPCHGSMYSIEDGSVVGGPAPAPLEEKAITVQGEEIVLG
jgi:Rieske Fe-S protein